MNVTWSRRALSDIAAVFAYVAAENEEAAARLAGRLYAAGEGLARFPELGRASRFAGRRESIVDQYVLTYRVHRAEVRIFSVEHGTRRR